MAVKSAPVGYPWKTRIEILICLTVLSAMTFRLVTACQYQLFAPFDITYETPVVATVKLIQEGHNPYDESFYMRPPYVMTMYTPVYHYVVAGVSPFTGENRFLPGRLVSMASLIGVIILPLRFATGLREAFLLAMCSSLLIGYSPTISEGLTVRMDLLAVLFSVFAISSIHKLLSENVGDSSRKQLWGAILAVFFALMAIATKQNSISASITLLLSTIIFARPIFTRVLSIYCVSAALAAIAFSVAWGEGFWFSILKLPQNPFYFSTGKRVLLQVFSEPMAISLLLLSWMTFTWRKLYLPQKVWTPITIFWVVSQVLFFCSIWKVGAGATYFFEPCVACTLVIARALTQPSLPVLRSVLLFCLAFAALSVSVLKLERDYTSANEEIIVAREQITSHVRDIVGRITPPDPRIVNFDLPIFNFDLVANPHVNDPGLARIVWGNGVLKTDSIIEELRQQNYDLVIVRKLDLDGTAVPRNAPLTSDVREALQENYEIVAYSQLLSDFFLIPKSTFQRMNR